MAVRKRAVRAERKRRRLLLSALFALLVMAVVAVIFYVNREPEIPVLDRKEDTSITFSDRTAEEIASLTVQNSEGEYTIHQENGVCTMLGREDFVFSEDMLSYTLQNAAFIYTDGALMDLNGSNYSFADFGLEDDCIRVQVKYTDGAEIAFRIGHLIPQETPQYYLRVEGDSRLFSTSLDMQETFMLSGDSLHAVTDPALSGDLIDKIAFTGENPFTMERIGSEWYMTQPFRYPLSSAKVNTLLEKLEDIRFAQYVSPAEKADLPAFGLSPARRTMTLSIAPSILTGYDENGQVIAEKALDGYELIFDCGDDIGDILFYCLYRGDVVKATRFSASVLLTQTYEPLLQTQPFALAISEMTRFEWAEGGHTRAWDITLHERLLPNNEFETDDSGNILYDMRFWREGAEADGDAFLTAFSRLMDVQTLQLLPADYALPESPAIVIRLQRENDLREVKLYPYGELHYAVSVDGKAVFYVSRDAIDGVKMPE